MVDLSSHFRPSPILRLSFTRDYKTGVPRMSNVLNNELGEEGHDGPSANHLANLAEEDTREEGGRTSVVGEGELRAVGGR